MADSHNVNHDYHIVDPSPVAINRGNRCVDFWQSALVACMRSNNDSVFEIAGVNLARARGFW